MILVWNRGFLTMKFLVYYDVFIDNVTTNKSILSSKCAKNILQLFYGIDKLFMI